MNQPVAPNSITREIPLSQGKVALVNLEDFALLSEHSWCVSKFGYAVRRRKRSDGPGSGIIWMHAEVLPDKKDFDRDHKDGNRLNNTRDNLRYASKRENARNARLSKNNTSGYKGVTWHKQTQKWRAIITVDRRPISLGLYETKEDAALAYNLAAIEYHREFACLNNVFITGNTANEIKSLRDTEITRDSFSTGELSLLNLTQHAQVTNLKIKDAQGAGEILGSNQEVRDDLRDFRNKYFGPKRRPADKRGQVPTITVQV